MPREMIHWHILDTAIQTVQQNTSSSCFRCLADCRETALLGAVAYDAPYYLRFGGSDFERVGEYLHGTTGDDPLVLLGALASHIRTIDESQRPQLWAFFLGMLSHLAVDVTFHPLVFYFTGDYHAANPQARHDARGRHRLYEVYLDNWCVTRKRLPCRSIAALQRSLHRDGGERLYYILDSTLMVETIEQRDYWREAITTMALLQRGFLSSIVGAIARGFVKISNGKGEALETLFSYGRYDRLERFDAPIQYRNPLSGEEFEHTVDELVVEARDLCVSLFERVRPILEGGEVLLGELLEEYKYVSLDYGIRGQDHESKARCFSDDKIELY